MFAAASNGDPPRVSFIGAVVEHAPERRPSDEGCAEQDSSVTRLTPLRQLLL